MQGKNIISLSLLLSVLNQTCNLVRRENDNQLGQSLFLSPQPQIPNKNLVKEKFWSLDLWMSPEIVLATILDLKENTIISKKVASQPLGWLVGTIISQLKSGLSSSADSANNFKRLIDSYLARFWLWVQGFWSGFLVWVSGLGFWFASVTKQAGHNSSSS